MQKTLDEYTTGQEEICRKNDNISPRLFEEYGVNRGLRDEKGNGVLTGLTNISMIKSSEIQDGKKVSCDGQLWYRGYRVEHLIRELYHGRYNESTIGGYHEFHDQKYSDAGVRR